MQTATTQNFISPQQQQHQQQQQQQQQSPHQHNLQKPQQNVLCDNRDLPGPEESSILNIQETEIQTFQQQCQSPMHLQLPHQHMEEKREIAKMCFVCCISITDTNYESVKSSMNHSHAPLLVLLTDVLGYKLNQTRLHSEVVCKSCYHLLDIIDELQQTLAESKTDVRTKFLETLSKMKLKYPRTDKMLKPRCLRCIQMSSTQTRKRGRGGRGWRGRSADVECGPRGHCSAGVGRGKGSLPNDEEIQQINIENDSVGSQSGDIGVTWKVLNPDDPSKITMNIIQEESHASKKLKKIFSDAFSSNVDHFHGKIRSADTNYLSEYCNCVEEHYSSSNSELFYPSKHAVYCLDSCCKYQYDIAHSCFSCGSNDEELMCLECSNCNVCKAIIIKWGYNVALNFKGIRGEINKVVENSKSRVVTFMSDEKLECNALGKEGEFGFELEKDTNNFFVSKKYLKKCISNTESVCNSRQTDLNKEGLENKLVDKTTNQILKERKSKYEDSPIKRIDAEKMKLVTVNENIFCTKNKTNLLLKSSNNQNEHVIILDNKKKEDRTTNKKDQKKFKKCENVKEIGLSLIGKSKYICEICGKDFNSRGGFKYHISGHRKSNIDIYSCEFCPHTTRKLSDLRKHISIHTGEKSFLCNLCNRSFSFNSSYRRHMRIHNEEKNHCCNICKKVFRTIDNLKAHKIKHTGERKYKCGICEKSFLLKHHYNTHLKLHTGKNKNKCQICNVNFRLKSELKDHYQKQHSNEETDDTVLTIVDYKKPDVLQQAMAAVDSDSMEIFTLADSAVESSVIVNEDNYVMENQDQINESEISSNTSLPKNNFSSSNIPSLFREDLRSTGKKNESRNTREIKERRLPLKSERYEEKEGTREESSQMYFVLSNTQPDNQNLYFLLNKDER